MSPILFEALHQHSNSETEKTEVIGAAPEGTADPPSAARAVRQMFVLIAPRYDLLNHLLSFNVDRLWWRRVAQTFAGILTRPGVRVLDLCCGTGDLTLALWRRAARNSAAIVGADFAHAMLQRAKNKTRESALRWIEADALQLPLGAEQFDLVTSAFGFRNLANYSQGLQEIFRVLRPGGEFGILDFGEPGGWMGWLYRIYFRHVLPFVGGLISGQKQAYAYLPASVERFPSPPEMLARMRSAGFTEVSWTPYTFGIAGLYRGRKSSTKN